jgi:hypothetical protein
VLSHIERVDSDAVGEDPLFNRVPHHLITGNVIAVLVDGDIQCGVHAELDLVRVQPKVTHGYRSTSR